MCIYIYIFISEKKKQNMFTNRVEVWPGCRRSSQKKGHGF